MTITTETTTPAEAILALQAQLDAINDAIGQSAGSWRELAGDPARAAVAATRLGDLERQREILRAAFAEAQRAQANERTVDAVEGFEQRAAAARERLFPRLDERLGLGEQLQEAVDRVGDLIQRLHDQSFEVSQACGPDVTSVSGIDSTAARQHVDSEDLFDIINQQLGRKLGRLWGVEIAPASFGAGVSGRIEREVGPLRHAFENGVAERRMKIGGAS